MQQFSLQNERAVVTGGGSGIGKAIAECLVAAGAQVLIAGRKEAPLQATVNALGNQADYAVFDVTNTDRAPELADLAADRLGGHATILINNAGIHIKRPTTEVTMEDFHRVLDTHVIGAMALSNAFVPAMQENEHGSVLFITSMAALFGIPYVAAYTAAKSAQRGLVRALAVEWSSTGVRINAIAPGWIDTDMSRQALENDPERKNKILSRTPMNRLGSSEDIGWAAVYLCSPAAAFITGHQLVVDGGASVGF